MPELPDLAVYLESLERRIVGRAAAGMCASLNPFLLRTAVPPHRQRRRRKVTGLRRIGKRIVLDSKAISSSSCT